MSLTSNQTESALQAAIVASLPEDDENDNWVYICDFSDSWVVYCSDGGYLQDDYTIDDDGNVTLAGNAFSVRPSTTYVPIDGVNKTSVVWERRTLPPEMRAKQLEGTSRVEVRSEPLTYRQDVRASYFQDFVLSQLGRPLHGAQERLSRHAREMDMLAEARERAARRRLDEGGFEYRTEPNTTQGTGGYFSPPAWLVELFAPARHARRPLADLIPGKFPLPQGVSSINIPILSTGTQVRHAIDDAGIADQDITDTAGTSNVAELAGMADVAVQLLEQSPPGAHIDWALYEDLTLAYDADLELGLINGSGTNQALLGIANVSGQVDITYTSASPTGAAFWPYLGYAMAQIGDGRDLPPECWLMRTARWAWLNASEDTATRPFGLPSPFFMGADNLTPDPVGGLLGLPAFLDDAIPATYGSTANQDQVFCVRPSDMLIFEGAPRTAIMREPGSGNLMVRIQFRNYAAAIVNRYAAGIAAIAGTGMVVQSSY